MYATKRSVGHQNTDIECKYTPVQAWAQKINININKKLISFKIV